MTGHIPGGEIKAGGSNWHSGSIPGRARSGLDPFSARRFMRTTPAQMAACGKSNFTANASCCVVPSTACGWGHVRCAISRPSRARHRDARRLSRASRSVIDHSLVRQFDREEIAIGGVWRTFSRSRIARRRASRTRHAAPGATTRSGRGVRNSWCAAHGALLNLRISSGEREIIGAPDALICPIQGLIQSMIRKMEPVFPRDKREGCADDHAQTKRRADDDSKKVIPL